MSLSGFKEEKEICFSVNKGSETEGQNSALEALSERGLLST